MYSVSTHDISVFSSGLLISALNTADVGVIDTGVAPKNIDAAMTTAPAIVTIEDTSFCRLLLAAEPGEPNAPF